MYRYHCLNCGHVYNPYLWDLEQEVEAWVDFDNISEDRLCPVCWENKDNFIEIVPSINEVFDINNLIPQEEQHIPFYTEKNGKIIVNIWTEDEPYTQDEDHFIEFVWVYDEYGEEIDIINFPDISKDIEFELADENYEVRASCSLHGVWKGIKIES